MESSTRKAANFNPLEDTMILIDSSNIKSVGFETDLPGSGVGNLYVRFQPKLNEQTQSEGTLYKYEGVPRPVYHKLVSALSTGKTFNELVKKGGYKFTKVEGVD